jgi:hypothetical protein
VVGSTSSSSARRRRKGQKALEAGQEKEEEKDGAGEEKKNSSDSSDEDDDDVHLPGLSEEAAIEKLKEKIPGENKASDLPVLEVPDQEVFEQLQYIRRGYVQWLAKAEATHVDDALQGCLVASTRTANMVSRGWKLISATPLWRSQHEDLEVNDRPRSCSSNTAIEPLRMLQDSSAACTLFPRAHLSPGVSIHITHIACTSHTIIPLLLSLSASLN